MAGGANAFLRFDHEPELTPFNDRGTGYNFYDGTAWGEIAYERVESVRIGWAHRAHRERS